LERNALVFENCKKLLFNTIKGDTYMIELVNRENFLQLAKVSPTLSYDYEESKRLAQLSGSVHEVIEEYFQTQPDAYRAELREFSRLNMKGISLDRKPTGWIFVPCFNEDQNLERIVKLFDRQEANFAGTFELCFILNCPPGTAHYQRLVRSIDILLRAKQVRPSIHIVSKIFTDESASLGRARKYGFDYCLQRISEQGVEQSESSFMVCTEGDTLELPDNYLRAYATYFKPRSCLLVQGKIEYPSDLLEQSEALRLFTSVREAVHEGQGAQPIELSEFGGLMPCGRNFALSPVLYAKVGGIDPIRRPGPEDDIILGADIVRLLGEDAKCNASVSLVTSPRREVLIIRDMLLGQSTNLKRAYEDFHNAVEIRDFETADIEKIVLQEFPSRVSPQFIPILLSQLYQWVISSCLKGAFCSHPEAQYLKDLYLSHQIGYWEKENRLWQSGCNWLMSLSDADRISCENKIADEALFWFQLFNCQHGFTFQRSNQGIKSQLIEPNYQVLPSLRTSVGNI